jgi:hypothetical protein
MPQFRKNPAHYGTKGSFLSQTALTIERGMLSGHYSDKFVRVVKEGTTNG